MVDGKSVIKLMKFAKLKKSKLVPFKMRADISQWITRFRRKSSSRKRRYILMSGKSKLKCVASQPGRKVKRFAKRTEKLDDAHHSSEIHEKALKGTANSQGIVSVAFPL